MLQMWTDFAKVGNPTPGDGTWQKVDPDQMRYLEIGSAGNQMNYSGGVQSRVRRVAGHLGEEPHLHGQYQDLDCRS